jgi:hypothetical protein
VTHVALAHEGLEIRAEPHPIRRVEVDHLHLPAQTLVVQQRVHHHQRIAEDHPVDPLVAILVGLEHLVGDRAAGIAEQVQPELRVELVTLERLDDALGREPLMHEQRQRGHIEGEPLRLARPVEKWRAQSL